MNSESNTSAIHRPPTGTELLAFAAFAAATSAGFSLSLLRLPPITGRPTSFGPNANWFGQPVIGYVAGLLVFVYAAKRFILLHLPQARVLWWYAMLVLCSLPYIWFLVVLDWFNIHVYHIECWVGYPITIWTIPTVSFIKDRLNPDGPSTAWYMIRSAIEIVILFPLWVFVWAVLSMSALGWIWI